jgi:hypothetical protein
MTLDRARAATEQDSDLADAETGVDAAVDLAFATGEQGKSLVRRMDFPRAADRPASIQFRKDDGAGVGREHRQSSYEEEENVSCTRRES